MEKRRYISKEIIEKTVDEWLSAGGGLVGAFIRDEDFPYFIEGREVRVKYGKCPIGTEFYGFTKIFGIPASFSSLDMKGMKRKEIIRIILDSKPYVEFANYYGD